MQIIRICLVALALAFVAAIVWASMTGSIGTEFSAITAYPWGKISIADLYLGFVAFAVVIWLVEKPAIAIPVILVLMVLGNPVALIWLVWRLPVLRARLSGAG